MQMVEVENIRIIKWVKAWNSKSIKSGLTKYFTQEVELEPVAGSDCGLCNDIALGPPSCGSIGGSAVGVFPSK